MISIYALINPLTDQIFYIGATKNPLMRIRQHHFTFNGCDERKIKLIRQLLSENKQAEMFILEECHKSEVQQLEEFYFDLFTSYGFKLYQRRYSGYNQNVKSDLNIRIATRIPSKLFAIYEQEAIRLDRPLFWLFEKAIKEFEKTLYTLN